MFVLREPSAWAQENFGESELGDPRRESRLVRVAGDLARHAGSSLLKSCEGDDAAVEGMYRLLRNEAVEPSAIAEGGFLATVKRASGCSLLLAVEDSTSLLYRHSVACALGPTTSNPQAVGQGFIVHSVVLVEGDGGATVGLVEQQRWVRDSKDHGKSNARTQRAYEEKESFKWQRAGEAMRLRLGAELSARTIAVCDREADVTAYLHWQQSVGGRYVVRAAQDRRLLDSTTRLWQTLAQAPRLGTHEVDVPQRGGRAARRAQVTLRSQAVELSCPPRTGLTNGVRCQAVLVREEHAAEGVEALEWLLLTSEPVRTLEEALAVLWMYGRRWRIEEFHKAWKSGTQVEGLRPRSAGNLERGIVILAFVAIRLLQLRELVYPPGGRTGQSPEPMLAGQSCEEILTRTEWTVLYLAIHKQSPPVEAPSAQWAYRAIARLGGWRDTQRTGRPGWQAVWDGMLRLADRVEAHLLALTLYKKCDQ